jgi:hypothetical protein
MLWVVILNGYPVFHPDTAEYLLDGFTLQQPIYRSIVYGIFMRLVGLEASLWLVVLAQSAVTIFILYLVFRYVVRSNTPNGGQSRPGSRSDK